MNLTCIVVDDEPLAIDILKNYIGRLPYLTLAATFNNGIDALEYLRNNSVDFLLSDIQMPDMTGMEMLKLLNKKVNVVFTSAYPQYALEGYDHQPLDFLVKPIPFDKFMRAVNRVQDQYLPVPENTEAISKDIYIKAKGKTIRLFLSDILYIEGLKDYVRFFTEETQYISQHSMKDLEEKLPSEQFIRIHKSYIVDVNKIEELKGNLVKIHGKIIPIGRQYKNRLFEIIESKKL